MSSRLSKLSLALGLIALFTTSSAAQSIQVEGLTEEDINTTYQDDGVRFTTDYLNKTVAYKDLFVPQYLHDDLNNFKAQYQGQGNQQKLQVQFKFKQAQKDGDGDMPGFLSQYQYQATQQVNPGQTQFQVQSSLDVDDLGNGTSLEEDADYDFQSQQNNEQLQIDGSLNRKLDGQQLLNDASLNFSKRAGEFAFDSGVIKPEVSSHYEHLIVNHTVRSSVSPEYGKSVNTTEKVFSGNETQRIPVSGDVERLSAGLVQQSVTHDNLYEDEERERLVVAHTPRTNISNVDFKGLNHSDRYSPSYSELVEPELDAANISNGRIQTPSLYEFSAWNVTYPADSQRTVKVNFSQPVYNPLTDNPENYEFSYFSYIVGSVATFKTDTSSEWNNGAFTDTKESSGNLKLTTNGFNPINAQGDGSPDRNFEAFAGFDTSSSAKLSSEIQFTPPKTITAEKLTVPYDTFGDDDSGLEVDVYLEQSQGNFDVSDGTKVFSGLSPSLSKSQFTIDIQDFSLQSGQTHSLSFHTTSACGKCKFFWKADDSPSSDRLFAVADNNFARSRYGSVNFKEVEGSGSYSSQSFTASEKKIWENITVSNFEKNGGTIDITVKTSNDGFSTVLESDTVQSSELSSGGTQTVDLALSQGATDVRYDISYTKGSSSPSIDSIEIDGKTANKPPQITGTKFIDDRASGITDLDFTLDDRTESDISGFAAAFTASTFTNSTLRGGVSLPFSDTVSVSDFPGASGSRSVDISETDSGLQERSGFGHTLGTQRIERQVTISNGDSNSIDYSLTTDLPGSNVIQGQSFTGTISGSSSVTETSITEDDFITGESESTFDRFSDTGFNHDEDTQQITNRTQLSADNSRSFSFTGVDISNTCSQTSSADVASGIGVTVTTDCNRPTFQVDKISQSLSGEFEDSTFTHDLGTQGIAKDKTLSEDTGTFSFSGVNVSAPSISGTIQNGGQRQVDLSAGGSVTETYKATGDFITGENEQTFNSFSDTGFNHDEDTQQIINRTQLVVDNTKSFQFGSVDVSSQCSQTSSTNVPSGSGVTATNDCNRPSFTVDKISQSTSTEFEDSTFANDLGTQGIAKNKTVSETSGTFSFTGVNLSEPAISGTLQNGGQRQVDLSAGGSQKEIYNATGDFITSESEVADRFQDAAFNHTENTVQFVNETDLVVDNTQSFQFNNVDISSQCSTTTTADIPSGNSVTATGGCNNNSFSGDFISESVTAENPDSTFGHSLSSQGIYKAKDVSNSKSFKFTDVTVFEPSITGTLQNGGLRNVTLTGSETETEFYNATSDFISNEREKTFIEAQNTSKSSSVASQAIFNQTELVVDNAKSFQFGSVDISNKCSVDTAADVPAGGSAQVTTQCNNQSFTVDRVEEANFDFDPAASEIVLGENYTGRRPVEFENTAANVNFSNLDTAPGVNTPGACTQTNASTVAVNAGNAKNQSVRFDCDPGTPGTPQKEIIPNQPATGFETVEYKTTAFVETNKTKNRPIIWQIDKSNLNDFNEREGGTLEATVDGQTRNVSVFDFPDTVEVRVDTDFGNSSLESGSHDMQVKYSYTVDSPGGGGGGGGGGAPEEESRTAVTFDPANVTAQPNSTGTSDFTIQNQLAEPLSVTVEVPDNNECRGFYLLNGSEQLQRQTYNVEGSTNSITGFRDVSYGFDAGADFVEPQSCEVRVGLPASAGSAGELVLTAEPEAGLVTELVVFLEDSFNVDLQQVRTLDVPLFSFESGEVENREVEYTGVQMLLVLGGAVAVYLVYLLFFRRESSSEN